MYYYIRDQFCLNTCECEYWKYQVLYVQQWMTSGSPVLAFPTFPVDTNISRGFLHFLNMSLLLPTRWAEKKKPEAIQNKFLFSEYHKAVCLQSNMLK